MEDPNISVTGVALSNLCCFVDCDFSGQDVSPSLILDTSPVHRRCTGCSASLRFAARV